MHLKKQFPISLIQFLNGLPVDAGVTAWTARRTFAALQAVKDGKVGIVLEVDLFAVSDKIVPRPQVPNDFSWEEEVLLKGTIFARPTPPY